MGGNGGLEKTLVLIKPDGVARGLCGEIIARFEKRGLKIVGLKMLKLTREQAERHYAEHKGKPFFSSLVDFITSGPLIAMVLSGETAIQTVRTMMGATNPAAAAPGTIRGDFALAVTQNIIHGADGPDSASREIDVFFSPGEILAEAE